MLGTLAPSIYRAPRHLARIGIVVHVNIFANDLVIDADATDTIGGLDPFGAVMREVVPQRHVVTVAARNHGETRRELERLSSGAGPFLIHQPDDLGFLLGLARYFFPRRRCPLHPVGPRDYS